MAYGVQVYNDLSGNARLLESGRMAFETLSGSTAQADISFFTDLLEAAFTTAVPASGSTYILATGNGGSTTVKQSADLTTYANRGIGVNRISTGTTNNSTGYANILSGTAILGIPTPPSGIVTKYEFECGLATTALFTTAVPGRIHAGFVDSITNAATTDGVYFEWDQGSTGGDTVWYIVHKKDGTEERASTSMTVAANKIYQLYLYVERNSAGAYTTTYTTRNLTDGTSTSAVLTAVTTARYPSATTDILRTGVGLKKQTTSTTTSTSILVDYIATRVQFPIERGHLTTIS